MKKLLFAPLVFFLAVALRAETVDLADYGKLTMTLASTWKVDSMDLGDMFLVEIKPKNGTTNAGCQLTIELMAGKDTETKATLRARMLKETEKEAAKSVEKRADLKEFAVKDGFGFSVDLTDPTLVGKPPIKDNFKVETIVKLHLPDNLDVTVTIVSDGFGEATHKQLLTAVGSLVIVPAKTAAKKK